MALQRLKEIATKPFAGPALALSVGAAAILSPLPANQAFAVDEYIKGIFEENAMPAEKPTKERPYYYMRFDENSRKNYPVYELPHALYLHRDKLIVVNFVQKDFVREGSRYSDLQTSLLSLTIAGLAPQSKAREMMLIDFVITSVDNYASYLVYAEQNKLGPNGASIDISRGNLLPYGLVIGPYGLVKGTDRLSEFALMHGVKTPADLDANIEAIRLKLANVVADSDYQAFADYNAMPAEKPTKERPYYYMRFDENSRKNYPVYELPHAVFLHRDKLIVLNFVREGHRFSDLQTSLLSLTIAGLAPQSKAKEMMLIDFVITGVDNYAMYSVYAKQNKLGPNGASIDIRNKPVLPYGLVLGNSLQQNAEQQAIGKLSEFALIHGVKTPADLDANIEAIRLKLANVAAGYNEK